MENAETPQTPPPALPPVFDFVFWLPGGHAVTIYQTEEQCMKLDESVQKMIAEAPDRWMCFNDGPTRKIRIHPKAVCGWHWQRHTKSTQEQFLELTKRMEGKMPPPDEGEDWKKDY